LLSPLVLQTISSQFAQLFSSPKRKEKYSIYHFHRGNSVNYRRIIDKVFFGKKISWLAFGIGVIVSAGVVGPSVAIIGFNMAKNQLTTFNEYRNGWELSAIEYKNECARDGSCYYDYDCDPYTVMVSHTSTDSKGNTTTLGNYTIASNRFPNDPQNHRYRLYTAIPENLISNAGVGFPKFWLDAYNRISAGSPGPVAIRSQYKNYILASDSTILNQYSGDITSLQKRGLLPKINSTIEPTEAAFSGV
jgi:hypothetical protein